MKKIYELTAFEIREKIKNKELTATEVVTEIIKRIKETDKEIGSFVYLREEKALEEAKIIDEKIKNGLPVGELAGVPVSIKDNMVSIDEPSQSASKILEGYRGIYDGTAVKKLKEADAIIIGKTNMDEFAMGSSTTTSANGVITRNPLDLDRVAGGSSGGAATSIAANQCFISLGSDTGGSIRQPASFCGVVGLKPTYGRVSRYGLMAFGSSFDQIGPVAKTVRDTALALNVISGIDDYDSTMENIDVPNYLESLTGDIKGIRVGIPKEYFIDGLDEDVRKSVERAISLLKEKGAEIVDISLPHTKYAAPTYYVLAPAEASSNLARFDGVRYGHRTENPKNIDELYTKSRSEGFGDEVKRRIMIGTYVLSAGYYDAYYKKAQKVRRLIKNDFELAFKNVDVILTPTTPGPAFKLDAQKTPIELYLEDIFTISTNLAGIPAISLPCGESKGLPLGVQIIGKSFCEGEILNVGDVLEKALKERV